MELLSPAGHWRALRAAAANGADAVYFGLDDFNARRRAANFRLEELADVVGFLHDRNVRAYITLNTLIFPDELERAAGHVAAIAAGGADAVIVQDLGLARIIRRMAPTLPIHASTQMTLSEPLAIAFAASLGVQRVILPRELSVAQIASVAAAAPQGVQVEVFCHGALCISWSGQCLASLALGGRSGNRGQCAQPCRLPYELLVDGKPRSPGRHQHVLSPRDLCALDHVGHLRAAGVAALKIEGRLKDEYYVAAATRAYRAAIDAAEAGREPEIDREDREALSTAFSRGFSTGYLDGPNPAALVAAGVAPGRQGKPVGVVVGPADRGIRIRLERPGGAALQAGDGVAFENSAGEVVQGGRVYSVRPVAPSRRGGARQGAGPPILELTFGRGDVDCSALRGGERLWRTDDPQTRQRLARTFARVEPQRRTALSARVAATAGCRLALTLQDESGQSFTVESDRPLERAVKHPLTVALLREQLDRLGETPFQLAGVELRGADGPGASVEVVDVMVPKSELGRLRRSAVEELWRRRRAAAIHAIAEPAALERLRAEAPSTPIPPPAGRPILCVLIRQAAQLTPLLELAASGHPPCDLVYAELDKPADQAATIAAGRRVALPMALVGPRIIQAGQEALIDYLAELAPPAVLVRNLATLNRLREIAPRMALIGDFSLNASNELAAGALAEAGLARLTPAYDLDFAGLRRLGERFPPAMLEVPIYRHIPMFHTQYCLWAAHLGGGRRPDECGRPCGRHELALRDRKGMTMPIRRDPGCRLTIYRGPADDLRKHLGELIDLGVGAFRLEMLDEPPRQVVNLVRSVRGAMRV